MMIDRDAVVIRKAGVTFSIRRIMMMDGKAGVKRYTPAYVVLFAVSIDSATGTFLLKDVVNSDIEPLIG